MTRVRLVEELKIDDGREFSVFDFDARPHGHLLLRGYPLIPPTSAEGHPRVMDIQFLGVSRVSSWNQFISLKMREASQAQVDLLKKRIGKLEHTLRVFLFQEGGLEDYVVAGAVRWAEFDLPWAESSPLDDGKTHPQGYSPVGGVIYKLGPRLEGHLR